MIFTKQSNSYITELTFILTELPENLHLLLTTIGCIMRRVFVPLRKYFHNMSAYLMYPISTGSLNI